MNNPENNKIIEQIGIDRNHIDTFDLETNEGTKRTKQRFHANAVEQRNNYVNQQLAIFNRYQIEIENEILQRYKALMPVDKTAEYDQKQAEVLNLLNVVKLNSNIPDSFKLKLDYIIAFINQNTSLEDLNKQIRDFIDKFQQMGINLTIEDFKYTMFTEKYMSTFLENADLNVLKESFEKIYFTCPDIKLQLKMNLSYIIKKYEKNISSYVVKLRDEEFLKYQVSSSNVIDKYTEFRNNVGTMIARDEYYNSTLFLDKKKKISDYLEGSPARDKNYNTFAINENYNELSDEAKHNYNSAIMGLYLTLNELKKYYGYEYILKDLLEKYKNKDSVKNNYAAKQKEIAKEEKAREGIYKDYIKSLGIGFLAKKNDIKAKDNMLKMNEQIKKLDVLYEEFKELEITYKLSNLNEAASIFDLFTTALECFTFLEKSFTENEDFAEKSLVENLDDYFRFMYNPNNSILRKINVFTEFDITSIVADKYKLLNLSITKEDIDKDNIDATMDTVGFINLIQNIEKSNISLHDIDLLCQMKEILGEKLETPSEEEII